MRDAQNNGRTALHGACWNGHTQVREKVLALAGPGIFVAQGKTKHTKNIFRARQKKENLTWSCVRSWPCS